VKLLTFRHGLEPPQLGVLRGKNVMRLAARAPGLPADMIELIAGWSAYREQLEALEPDEALDHLLDEVTLCAPILRPGKLLGIGLNYADHVAEAALPAPTDQVWFMMPPSAVNGPRDPIQMPKVSLSLDYEAELAFVIGRRCRHVSRERAHEVIFGYCAANDVSVRDWQLRTSQVILGKSFDSHAPFGPWIVTTDELNDPHCLGIRCFVNGEKRQDSNTRELIHNCFDQVEHLSKVMTLEPGDVIFSGTPAGVGFGFKPPRWLAIGDVVRVEIDNIGFLENRVAAEPEVPYGT
jgi:2-keto-4-pentenoate hydratase/2-oxohepta-3-ene-1,7-dioic acid hydratase in catechol pathway